MSDGKGDTLPADASQAYIYIQKGEELEVLTEASPQGTLAEKERENWIINLFLLQICCITES